VRTLYGFAIVVMNKCQLKAGAISRRMAAVVGDPQLTCLQLGINSAY